MTADRTRISHQTLAWTTIAASVLLAAPAAAQAPSLAPGFDLWTTPPAGAVEDFGDLAPEIDANLPALPPGFFGPGSQPFVGVVEFAGDPVGTYLGQPTGPADTIVQRPDPIDVPSIGSMDTVPVQIVELSLQSVAPIEVIISGQPTEWSVHVDLAPFPPSGGQMTVTRTRAKGGFFDAEIGVCGILTFTQVVPPLGTQVFFDICQQLAQPQIISTTNHPWSEDAEPPIVSPLSGPQFFALELTEHTGPHPAAQPIENAAAPLLPGPGPWTLAFGALLLAGAGAMALRRLRRPAIA